MAGIPDIQFHALRHSAATLLVGQSSLPKIISAMRGHAYIFIPMDTYSHVTLDMQGPASSAMDRLFGAQGSV